MQRFPLRTLVLMILTLLSFVWFWWRMHRVFRPTPTLVPVTVERDGGR